MTPWSPKSIFSTKTGEVRVSLTFSVLCYWLFLFFWLLVEIMVKRFWLGFFSIDVLDYKFCIEDKANTRLVSLQINSFIQRQEDWVLQFTIFKVNIPSRHHLGHECEPNFPRNLTSGSFHFLPSRKFLHQFLLQSVKPELLPCFTALVRGKADAELTLTWTTNTCFWIWTWRKYD